MSELKGPEAYVACLILSGEPWTLASAEAPAHSIVCGGAKGAVAAAIGGLAGWIDGAECAEAIEHAAQEMHPRGAVRSHQPEWTEPMFVLGAAISLRDTALGTRGKVEENPKNEYAFCISDHSDCLRLGEMRKAMGRSWSEGKLAGCARAMVAAMDAALAREGVANDIVTQCAVELVALLELVESIRPELLDFLKRWSPRMKFPSGMRHGMGCRAYEGQDCESEACDLGRIGWDWVASAPAAKGRTDFPWGFWIAWSMPSLLEKWGMALGVDWAADGQLACEISKFEYDRDEWSETETKVSLGVAAALERMSILAVSAAGRSVPKKSL